MAVYTPLILSDSTPAAIREPESEAAALKLLCPGRTTAEDYANLMLEFARLDMVPIQQFIKITAIALCQAGGMADVAFGNL